MSCRFHSLLLFLILGRKAHRATTSILINPVGDVSTHHPIDIQGEGCGSFSIFLYQSLQCFIYFVLLVYKDVQIHYVSTLNS